MRNLQEIIREYKEINEEIKVLEESKKKLRNELLEILGREFEGKVGNYVVKVNEMKRTVFDSKKIYEEITDVELLNKISKKLSYPVIRIKELQAPYIFSMMK